MTISPIIYPRMLNQQQAYQPQQMQKRNEETQQQVYMSPTGQKVQRDLAFGEYQQAIAAQNSLVKRHEEAHRIESGPQAVGSPVLNKTSDQDGREIITGGHQMIAMPQRVTPTTPPEQVDKTIEAAHFAEKGALAPQSFDELSDADKNVAATSRQIGDEARAIQVGQGREPVNQTNPIKDQTPPGQNLNVIG